MDSGTIHGIVTILMMVIFVAIVWWAFSKHTQERFRKAANLPFADEPEDVKKKGAEHE